MYKNKSEVFISAESGTINISSSVCFHYKGKITYVWTIYGPEGYVVYSGLFPNAKQKGREMFIKQLGKEVEEVKYFVIYSTMGLNLTEEGKLENVPIKFDNIVIKKLAVLRDYLCANDRIKEHGFYRFSRDKKTENNF